MHDPLIRGLASEGKVKSTATRGPGVSWLGSAPQAGAFSGFQYLTPPEAVYPEEAIRGHRAFITRRRQLRLSEEYRTPADTEWEEFPGHFERRRVALGDCGRAYSTSCIHEHVPHPMPAPENRPRPAAPPRRNPGPPPPRIAEAEREGWTGEAEGLQVSLAAANNKLAQADMSAVRRACAVGLYPLEAGTALLIGNGTFLHRDDFTSKFIVHGTSSGTPMAAIDWDAAATALTTGGLPCSGGERRILLLSASLAAGTPVTGLDNDNTTRLLAAIRHAVGKRPEDNGYR